MCSTTEGSGTLGTLGHLQTAGTTSALSPSGGQRRELQQQSLRFTDTNWSKVSEDADVSRIVQSGVFGSGFCDIECLQTSSAPTFEQTQTTNS